MTHQQMTLLIVLLLFAILSVGAFLLTSNEKVIVEGPDPSTLPATPVPATPGGPPEFLEGGVLNPPPEAPEPRTMYPEE